VLVVDDNEALAQALVPMLESMGCTVYVAGNADQALSMLAAGTVVDVVLSDLVMPGTLDGIGLAEEVIRVHPQMPVVLMTGHSVDLVRARGQGFEVLPKPCSPQVLVQALSQALQRRVAPA
jgi:DNA-binding NtrC family response regulator